MVEMLTHLMPLLPTDKPNHLLGIGDLPSLEACIPLGIDTFDSSHPTRAARHGTLFTTKGLVKVGASANKTDFNPVDPDCTCRTCRTYSRAYLHHLFKAKEVTGSILATIHNLHFMVQLMAEYREKIMQNKI